MTLKMTMTERKPATCDPLEHECPTCRVPVGPDALAEIEAALGSGDYCPRCLRPPARKTSGSTGT